MKIKNLLGITCVILFSCMLQSCDEQKDFAVDEIIYLNYKKLDLYYGDKIQLTISPGSGVYEWKSGNTTIARVNDNGEIEAVGVGETYIVVSTKDGNAMTEIPVVVTVPKADKITGRPGKYRAAVELDIRSELIKAVKITRLDTNESSTTNINFQEGVFTAFYEGLSEGKYSFKVVCIDQYDMESTPVELDIRVYGDAYQSIIDTNEILAMTVFGTGLVIKWNAGISTDFTYTNLEGKQVTQRFDGKEQSSYLYDFLSYPLTECHYVTAFLPDEAAIDTFYTERADTPNSKLSILTSTVPVSIRAYDFNLGGEGVAFHDSDDPRNMSNYRKDLGDFLSNRVDIEGGGNIGYTNANEWLKYTVYVEDPGIYAIDWYVSVNGSPAKCRIITDEETSGTYNMDNNSNWSDWRYYCERKGISPPKFNLTKGFHTITFYFESGSFNYNGLKAYYSPN